MEEFKHLNPKKLELCYKGHKLKKEEEDRHEWQRWGDYGISALIFAIDHCLNGKKAQSEYIKKPITDIENSHNYADEELSENEIIRQRELHRLKMETIKANFELTHPKKEKKE